MWVYTYTKTIMIKRDVHVQSIRSSRSAQKRRACKYTPLCSSNQIRKKKETTTKKQILECSTCRFDLIESYASLDSSPCSRTPTLLYDDQGSSSDTAALIHEVITTFFPSKTGHPVWSVKP